MRSPSARVERLPRNAPEFNKVNSWISRHVDDVPQCPRANLNKYKLSPPLLSPHDNYASSGPYAGLSHDALDPARSFFTRFDPTQDHQHGLFGHIG